MKKRWNITLGVFLGILVIFLIGLYLKTGFLQASKIDERDLVYWNYTDRGFINGAEDFTLEGNNNRCWLLIHGYTSTPQEMRELAKRLNYEFNQTVRVPRMIGCGEVPSRIINLTFSDWYNQLLEEYEILDESCDKVSIVGFSFGGTIALKIAEEKELESLYLIAPYIYARYKPIRIFKLESYINVFEGLVGYSKKLSIVQINDEEAAKNHIAYWNMPFAPVKYSKGFIQEVVENLSLIKEPVLIQHSKGDETADIKSSEVIFEGVNSKIKDFVIFEKSNHAILEDFDKQEAMDNIINFEKNIAV